MIKIFPFSVNSVFSAVNFNISVGRMRLKLLVHVNEPERWTIAMSNITNFLNDVSDDNAVVVVFFTRCRIKILHCLSHILIGG